MEEKARFHEQNSKKGCKVKEHGCRVEGVFIISNFTASLYLKLASSTQTNQSWSKLLQF